MMNETQFSFRVDIISNILLERTAISKSCNKRNSLFELLYLKDNLGDQINKNNFKTSFEHLS